LWYGYGIPCGMPMVFLLLFLWYTYAF
jgi:hypothetical protein